MALHLTLVPVTADQLARLRSDPAAVGTVVSGDEDRDRLRRGGVVHLYTAWHVLHYLVTRGETGPPELGFLIAGGAPIGDRARAFRASDVARIAAGLPTPGELEAQFDEAAMASAGVWFPHPDDGRPDYALPLAVEQLDELRALLSGDGAALLVVRDGDSSEVDVRRVTDAALDRYLADPSRLEVHLEHGAAPPPGGIVVSAWYALQVALNELGDTEPHHFVDDGGELLDEAVQLRAFSTTQVRALDGLLAEVDASALTATLTPQVLDREGLEAEEAETLAGEYLDLRGAVAGWARDGQAMIGFMR